MKCPSCGREIPDDSVICPHCTANVKRRVRIKVIYIVAISLIVVSSFYAFLAYASPGVEITKIKDLGINQNYNFVHVRGNVVDYPRAYEGDYGVTEIVFTISDGTDDISIKIYRGLIDEAVKEGKIPGIGDTVDVSGTFSYSTKKTMTVNNIDLLHVIKGKFEDMKIEKIYSASPWDLKNGKMVSVLGNITGMREYSFGVIASIDEKVDLLIPRAYYSLNMIDLKDLSSGYVRINGSLEFYEMKNPSSKYTNVNLSEIMKNPEKFNNTNVRISWAQVVDKDENSNIIVVNSNDTNITVYVASGVKYYNIGERVEIQGKFQYYNGNWEIGVIRENDYVSEPRWEIIAHPQYKIIEKKNYTKEGEFEMFSLREIDGVVADYSSLSSGISITLWNNNTSYNVYVENEKSIIGNLDYGTHVRVRGMLTIYKGEWEIKVRAYSYDFVEVVE